MTIKAYLFFAGRADEAIDFYKEALGAETLMLMRFADSPEPPPPGMVPDGFDQKVMHASLRVGDAELMVSDGCASDAAASFEGFSLTLTVPDAAAAERTFGALSEGGEVRMPLGKTFFSPAFGMLADRFGVPWSVVVEA